VHHGIRPRVLFLLLGLTPLELICFLNIFSPVAQDLKDFARNSGQLDVVYSETGRERDGKG
jgi:hypothetical protein